jgi:hypothetical protein
MNDNISYTLQGSQPYVLSAQWPSNFVPLGTEMVVDNSMNNIVAYNITSHDKYAEYNNYSNS